MNKPDQQYQNSDSDFLLGLSGTLAALVGYSVVFLLPSFVETAAGQFDLNNQQIGWLGATDTGGLALMTLLTAVFIQKLDLRLITRLGVVLALLANVATLQVDSYSSLCITRFVAGLGEGLLVTAGIASLAQTKNQDRWFSIYTAAAVVLQASGLFLFPYVVELWQLNGIIVTFAALLILPLLLSGQLASKNQQLSTSGERSTSRLLALATGAVMMFYISIGAVWTYVATMGTDAGFSFEWVSTALSISMVGGFLGAVGLATYGHLAKGSVLFIASGIIMLLSLVVLATDFNQSQYQWTLVIYAVVWSVIAARLYSLIAIADNSGRYITATQPVLNIGFALGPLMSAALLSSSSFADTAYLAVTVVAAVALILCLVLIFPLANAFKDKL